MTLWRALPMKKVLIAGSAGLCFHSYLTHSTSSPVIAGQHRAKDKPPVAASPHSAIGSSGHVSGFSSWKAPTCCLGETEEDIYLGVTDNGGITKHFAGAIDIGHSTLAAWSPNIGAPFRGWKALTMSVRSRDSP